MAVVAGSQRCIVRLLQRENQAILANRETDALCWGAAQELDEAVVAAASADGILRAQPCAVISNVVRM